MGIYSKLDGPLSIYPASGGVWRIRKKRKTDDHKPRDKKKRADDEKDPDEDSIPGDLAHGDDSLVLETDDHSGYDSAGKRIRVQRKIDLTI